MGNWRNRRRFYREKPPPPCSPPRSHQAEPTPASDGIPSWEKRFCALIGSVPWWKVVSAKKFVYCNPNVLNWDDSAGEEAFQNAKRRFWANINRLPCDVSLPDPDMYIDEINWNPDIDPELVEELDRAYFAPDEERKYGRKNKKTKSMSAPLDEHNRNQDTIDNPWESNNMLGSATLKDGLQGWNHWDSHVNELGVSCKDENPWEHSYAQASGTAKIIGWGHCGDGSWGWNLGGNSVSQSKTWDNGDNHWKRSCEGVGSIKDKGWSDTGNNSWVGSVKDKGWNNTGNNSWVGSVKDKGWNNTGNNSWGLNHYEPRNLDNVNNPWKGSFIQNGGGLKDRGQRGCGDSSWGWEPRDNYTTGPKSSELQRTTAGWESWNDGSQKREDSHWYTSGYKNSRFQGDSYQSCNSWSKGRSKKRVNFAS